MTIRQLQIETALSLPLRGVHRRSPMENGEVASGVRGIAQTPLAARMLELRGRVERKGDGLLSLEEVRSEVKARRGERD